MDNQIKARLEELKTYLGFTSDGKFSDFVHLSRSNYSKIMSGGRVAGDSVINKICLYTNANKKWLLTGEGEMLSQAPIARQGPNADVSKLIELMGKQQEQIMSLVAELERKSLIIDNLRVELSQKRS